MLGLMASVKACEELVIEAAEAGSRAAAWQAFALHPLVNSTTLGRRLLDAYAAAHPQLARFG
jgi:6-phospho-beta-glucosidase